MDIKEKYLNVNNLMTEEIFSEIYSLKDKLPAKIVFSKYKNYYIAISPEEANYIICNNIEYKILKSLIENKNIKIFSIKNEATYFQILQSCKTLLWKIYTFNFCGHGYLATKLEEGKGIKSIVLDLTTKCNIECIHCYKYIDNLFPVEMPISQLTRFLKLIFYTYPSVKKIQLTGGEPFLYTHIFELLNFLNHRKDRVEVTIKTNGVVITPKILQLLMKSKFILQISLDAVSKNIYEKVRQRSNFNIVMNNIINLKDKIEIHIGFTIFNENFTDIMLNLENFLINIDQEKHLTLSYNYNIIPLMKGKEIEPLSRSQINKVHKLFKHLKNKGWRIKKKTVKEVLKYRRNCGICEKLLIDPNGNILPCSPFNIAPITKKFRVANIEDITSMTNLKFIMKNFLKKYDVENIPKCKNCVIRFFCGGDCRILKFFSTNSTTKSLCHLKKSNIYSEMIQVFYSKIERRLKNENISIGKISLLT